MGAGSPITMLDTVGSTNDEALALGRGGAAHASAVAARTQTAGRGRRGHTWESPRGNLYLSVVLRPQVSLARLSGLAAACGLGVADVLRQAQLKWPNDLLAHGRKLAGILIETTRDVDDRLVAVCGVGVNVELAPRELDAISLAELGDTPSFSALAAELRDGIVSRVDEWAAAPGDWPLDGIHDDYLARLAWLDERVCVLSSDGERLLAYGTFETVDLWGRAVVEGVAYAAELSSLRPFDEAYLSKIPRSRRLPL